LIPVFGTFLLSHRQMVGERNRFGDWEADLILGHRGSGAIATHVERKSRFLMVTKLADRRAETINAAALLTYQQLPESLRQTLTLYNERQRIFSI
jgi:IS30 family transposase